jgi:P-type conjugative transfer ATPase TrbB
MDIALTANQETHSDEKQGRLKEKLRDELGSLIVGMLDWSSGLEDIVVNEDSRIWVKRTGVAFECVGELSARQARGAMMTIASMQKTTVTESRPVLETQLPIWKFRFAGLIEPVVPSPSFAIRIKPDKKRSLDDLRRQGILTGNDDPRNRRTLQDDFISQLKGLDHLEIIQEAIRARKNILIVGGTGAGKTTVANAILEEIGILTPADRVLVIEDTQELLLDSANSLSLLATAEFDQLKCLKVALRLKPDRIVVGEVRDGAAALPLLKAWNTGHPGGVSTIHANSATEALIRLEDLVREATEAPQQRMIGAAVDVVVSVVNDQVAGRKIQEVAVVTGWQDGRYLLTQV